jgi:hypothetical protein
LSAAHLAFRKNGSNFGVDPENAEKRQGAKITVPPFAVRRFQCCGADGSS